MPASSLSLSKRRRASKRSAETPDIEFINAKKVYETGELLSMIASHIDWYTLMSLSRSGQDGRKAARYEARDRFRALLKPYMDTTQFQDFLDELDRCNGLVCGSIAMQLLKSSGNAPAPVRTPFDLNLVVTKAGAKGCMDFFTGVGFSAFATEKVGPNYVGCVGSFRRAVKDVAGVATFVTISVAKTSAMNVILASPFSTQTNAVSSTRVYSFFPHIITSPFGVRGNASIRGVTRPSLTYKVLPSNIHWKNPCGPHCITLIRKTWGDKGVGSFAWNDAYPVPSTRYPGTDYLLAEKNLLWRFAMRCRNLRCERYSPSASRHT